MAFFFYAVFPMQDMSAIVAKQWDANGTIRKTVYKPFNEQMTDSSIDDKKIEIGLSDDATKAITDKLDCLFGKIEELSKSDYVARSLIFTKENFSARHPKSIFF